MNFAQRIKEVRALRGMSQQDLADKLNISKSLVSHWETSNRTPPMGAMGEIAEKLGVSVSYLIGDTVDAIEYDANTKAIAEAIDSRPELKMLFNASIDAKRDDILMCVNILERLK